MISGELKSKAVRYATTAFILVMINRLALELNSRNDLQKTGI
jgi:hypothetical protein